MSLGFKIREAAQLHALLTDRKITLGIMEAFKEMGVKIEIEKRGNLGEGFTEHLVFRRDDDEVFYEKDITVKLEMKT